MVSSLVHTLSVYDSLTDLGTIEVRDSSLAKKNGYICVDLFLHISCLSVGANQSVSFTPILVKDKYRQELPAVVIYGKERFRAYRKKSICSWLLSFRSDYNIYKVIEAKNGEALFFSYSIMTPAKDWMLDAKIGFYDHKA